MSNSQHIKSTLDKCFTVESDKLSEDDLVKEVLSILTDKYHDTCMIVSIIGGAASGKSSISSKVSDALQNQGLKTEILCTDDYVVGDREYRQKDLKGKDASKKYDFTLMDKHIEQITNLNYGESIKVPEMDPKTGLSVGVGEDNFPRTVKKPDILIIEGDFPRNNYDLRFFIHIPDEQRLSLNLKREKPKNHGELIGQFNDRQRTIHKPYTMHALKNTNYVIDINVAKTSNWQYSLLKKQAA